MSFFDRLRDLFSGSPRMAGGGDPEAAADLHEEYSAPDAGEADLEKAAETGGDWTGGGGSGASEAAETAEEDLASEEAPPDPAP